MCVSLYRALRSTFTVAVYSHVTRPTLISNLKNEKLHFNNQFSLLLNLQKFPIFAVEI